jgi:hypothetical protein
MRSIEDNEENKEKRKAFLAKWAYRDYRISKRHQR